MRPQSIPVYAVREHDGKLRGPHAGTGSTRARWYVQRYQAEKACKPGERVLRGIIVWEDDGNPMPDPWAER